MMGARSEVALIFTDSHPLAAFCKPCSGSLRLATLREAATHLNTLMSTKQPHSQDSSGSAPLEEQPPSNRRSRRKEKQQAAAVLEAGPSGSNAPISAVGEGAKDSAVGSALAKSTFAEADFIPFSFSDPEEPAPAPEDWPPEREWDKGKGKRGAKENERGRAREREREPEHAGRKRKADEINLDDGYANKKQRTAAASRKAPWVTDVDWDSCANVAEMYACKDVALDGLRADFFTRLHHEVEAFVSYISPTPIEDEVRSLVVALVARAVNRSYPDAQVLPFGSYETKLYLPLGCASRFRAAYLCWANVSMQ